MLCKHPSFIENVGGIVRCGRCHHCRIHRRREKTARIVLEGKGKQDCLFVTLTYSDEFLPTEIYDLDTGEIKYFHETGCLDKRAIQLFKKRLLRRFPPRTIRFWCAGEYGEKRGRPHYHLVIWGVPYERRNAIYESWTDPVSGRLMSDPNRIDIQIPRSDWDVGAYCASYVVKSMTKADDSRLEGRPPDRDWETGSVQDS